MFENLGKRIQSILLVALIVLLALVMGVVGFSRPQLDGCRSQGATFAARVYGSTITDGDFRAAFTITGFNRYPPERAEALHLRELTLQGLIERELLVREAERLGFEVDPTDVLRHAMDDQVVLLGGPVDAPPGYPSGELPQNFEDRNGQFSTENMRRFIQNYLRRSMEEFTTWQVKETLAERVRNTVTAAVTVSSREVWDAYVAETERAQLNYVRFNPAFYRDEVQVEAEALTAWMQEHTSEVDQEYRRERHRYTALPLQVRSRHILIEVAHDAPQADRDAARARAQALLVRAQGGEDFAALARANSNDTGSARRGGDLGFNPRGRMVAPFDEAQFGTEPGHIVDHVVESTFGFHVIKVEARREGDVPEAEAKREVAEDLYRRAQAGEVAHREATRALEYLRAGHSAEELDERLLRGWDSAEPPEGQTLPPAPERHPLAPVVAETRRFGRADRAIPGSFDSGPLTRAAFEMTMDHPLPDAPIQLGDDWFVYRLMDRTEASQAGFDDATQGRLEQSLLESKRHDVLSAYVHRLLAAAADDDAIRRNGDVLAYPTQTPEHEGSGTPTAPPRPPRPGQGQRPPPLP